jgi:hypothetical protein
MAVAITSPVTGGAQSTFTSPTYTIASDIAPDVNGKQYAVTALGGTQTGVTAHSVASPFTTTFWKPKAFKVLGKPNPTTGLLPGVPVNVYKLITRKGMLPLAAQPYAIGTADFKFTIPAGADTADAANVKALVSMSVGSAWQISSGLGDTLISGIV